MYRVCQQRAAAVADLAWEDSVLFVQCSWLELEAEDVQLALQSDSVEPAQTTLLLAGFKYIAYKKPSCR